MLQAGPRLVQLEAKKAHFRVLERGVAARAELALEARVSLVPLRRLLRGSEVGAAAKDMAKVVVADGVWTNQRLWEAGYDLSPTCACGSGPDTLEHRFFECRLSEPLRLALPAELEAGPGS